MSEQEMRDLILSKIPTRLITHHQLWRLCGNPLSADGALFDKVLLSLAHNNEIASGVVYPEPESLVRQPLRGYAGKESTRDRQV